MLEGSIFLNNLNIFNMRTLSEKVANSFRTGKRPKPNPNNLTTRKRRALYNKIMKDSHGNIGNQISDSLNIVKEHRPLIESYVMSRNEAPMDNIEDLVKQAYELRSREIDDTAELMGVSEGEAVIFIEDDEAFQGSVNNYSGGSNLGELFAPIGIAAKYLSFNGDGSDNFVDSNLISGLVNTVGTKLDSAELKRAAANKPSGIIGFLSGGKREYETLRAYLQDPANKDERDKVLKGIITDVSQLKGYGSSIPLAKNTDINSIAGSDVIDQIARLKKQQEIKKMLPFIIIGVVVLIFVTVLIVKNAKRK